MSAIDVPAFYLNSFTACAPGSVNPVTEFANGADIQLNWRSNGTSFTVYAAHDGQPVYQGTAPTCTVAGGRTRTTTFIVAASVTGGPASGTPNPDFETISLYDALTVTIKNPDETPAALTAGTLTVSGQSQLRGDATLGNATAGTMTVTGNAALNGGATATGLSVSGATSLAATTLTTATVNGSLGVTGPATLAAATVGTLTVTGSVAMMAPRTVNPGTWYVSSSDGILVGAVWYPSDAGKKCSALINGYADGIGWVWATGGNTVVHQNTWGSTMWSNANTFAIPVRKGTSFTGNVNQLPGREVDAPTGFWWVPFGRSASLAEMSVAEATALGLELPELPEPETPTDYDPSTAIAEIVDVIKELAGGAIPDPAERELTVALRSLVMHQP
jgi:hypothetical protein